MLGKRKPDDRPPCPPEVTDGALAARAARERAKHGLMSAIESGERTRKLADQVREHGRRNGFGEMLEESMRRKQQDI